ncbi:phage tail assembly chaperone G [Atopobacter phocae]|uniref:phage tail assembly chaperone G n=1 Tax=Atopobacter phocae TaxID=136492 RepID=UPI0004709086|nr:hypothetical protein [Atopobacter phocae]
MERTFKLELRQPNNKFKTFTQDFVPFGKRQEYIRLEKELEKKYKENVPEEEYARLQIEFVAGLFENEEVTPEAINNGLEALDRDVIYEIIRYRVLGFNKEDDEQLKKVMTEELLAGQNIMTINSSSSEK